MGTFSGAPKKDFAPSDQLSSYDTVNDQRILIPGQSLLDYIGFDDWVTDLLGKIPYFNTNNEAKTVDLPLNVIIYTGGDVTVSDGGGGHYLVVETGGSVVLNNGYELLLLPLGSLAGADASLALVDSDTGASQTLQDALNDRSTDFDGFAEIDVTGSDNILLTADQARNSVIRFFGTTSGDISVSTPTNNPKTYLVINNDDGGNTITFKTNSGSGVEFSLTGEQRNVRSDGTNMQNNYHWDLGEVKYIDTSIGMVLPDNSSDQKFVLLTEGLTGAGQYNEGLIDNEVSQVVTAENGHDYLEKTADLLVGPFTGETVHMLNSESASIRPGETPGQIFADQMQRITGMLAIGGDVGFSPAVSTSLEGAFTRAASSDYGSIPSTTTASGYGVNFDSADSPDARTSSATDGPTYDKHVTRQAVMRVA